MAGADDVVVKYGGDTAGAENAAMRVVNSIRQVTAASTVSIGQMRANTTNLRAQMIDIAQGIPLLFQSPTYGLLNLGNQMAQIAQITGGSVTQAFGLAAKSIGRFAIAFAPVLTAVGAVVGAIFTMQNMINSTSKTQVSFMNVMVGTFRAIGDVVTAIVTPIQQSLQWLFDALAQSMEGLRQLLVLAGNMIVGVFVGAFNAVKATWDTLPQVLGDAVLTTVNFTLELIRGMINAVLQAMNDFANQIGGMFPGFTPGKAGELQAFTIANPFEGAAGAAGPGIGKAFQDAMTTDWMGMFFENIKKYSIEEALKPSAADLKKWAQTVDSIMDGAAKKISELKAQTAVLWMGREAGIAYAEAQRMIYEATAAGVPMTAALTAEINRQANAIAAATVELEYQTAVQDTMRGIAEGISGAFRSWLDGTDSLGMALLKMTLQLAAAVAEALLLNLILSAMGLTLPTTGLGAVFAPLFGGGKAEGGPLQQGKWHMAGENGPEPIWGGGIGSYADAKGGGGKMDPQEFASAIADALGPLFRQQSHSTRTVNRTLKEASRRMV